ncbi:Alpha-glucoside transport system permease protein AglF (plasmid) [Neorhizobium galegae bv. officinalis bv. officinalis str. HAMBI 1141]|uniref:Alpha-glucoside transport system permease protein AglF n=1 Tax=Neorhizobium galegae bv. officinalis bv. officinalis str. HAMBI 1141 TaxID=1028801 RepID=A0A068TGG5_NEOGA|nr:sugar ABC transporter permease [Neorhizobium galegae]CDN57448.1 Alpha-glucoside transport system permease protein AglF [Neorhizobium galegae bv. officinalis bv. officinalis str. HAMBI 1141]
MSSQILQLILGLLSLPAVALVIILPGELAIRRFPQKTQSSIRPWIWLSPVLALVGLVIAYPLVASIVYSFRDATGSNWVGFRNFVWAFGTAMRPVLFNNVLWIVVFPLLTAVLALTAAIMLDRVKYERVARTFLILPTAMSFVAGAVIWKMMYTYEPPMQPQTGTLNAIWTAVTGKMPIAWLIDRNGNNYALIFVAVWMSIGVATLILSAGVKNIPRELVEAAKIDGAGEWAVFRFVTLPSLWPTILVVLTTQAIFSLKVFDIVYVMTNGSFGTDVIANKMYSELFVKQNLGTASAIAVLLLILASPVIFMNIKQIRSEGGE